jgi:hypothetical protein
METVEAKPIEQAPAAGYETEVCGRCGGSGHYSYCQMWGTICFQCRGAGKHASKRGAAAMAYARDLRTVKASEVRVGWWLYVDASPLGGHRAGWYVVEEITQGGAEYAVRQMVDGVEVWKPYTYLKTRVMSLGFCEDSTVQAVPGKERLVEIRALAMAYQATLTKQGKPMRQRGVSHVHQRT